MNTGKEYLRPKKTFPQANKNFGRHSTIESHGPDGKVRGNAQQIIDRYTTSGKEALRESDFVLAESFFQHADHYRRLLSQMRPIDPPTESAKPNKDDASAPHAREDTIILAPHSTATSDHSSSPHSPIAS
jgi:hypothetical protein